MFFMEFHGISLRSLESPHMPVLLGNSKASRQRMAKLQALSAAPSASPENHRFRGKTIGFTIGFTNIYSCFCYMFT